MRKVHKLHSNPSFGEVKKTYLPNKTHVFGQGESVENYWDRIWNEICKNYPKVAPYTGAWIEIFTSAGTGNAA